MLNPRKAPLPALLSLLAFLLLLVAPAIAQDVVRLPPHDVSYVTLTGAGKQVVLAQPGVLYEVTNTSNIAAASGVTCTLYDNPTTNSGNGYQMGSGTDTGLGPGQTWTLGGEAGIKMYNGITVYCNGNPGVTFAIEYGPKL